MTDFLSTNGVADHCCNWFFITFPQVVVVSGAAWVFLVLVHRTMQQLWLKVHMHYFKDFIRTVRFV